MIRPSWTPTVVLLLAAGLAACDGSSPPADSPEGRASAEAEAPDRSADEDPAVLAQEGEELFQDRGCNACHTFGGGQLVGPDLAGVTERRERPWIEAMILNPDSMVRNDSTAKELLAEYFTPMQSMGVTPEGATALYHFMRRQDEGAEGRSP